MVRIEHLALGRLGVCWAGANHVIDNNLRSGDDYFGINELLVELGVLTLLVRGGDKSVALVLDPFSDTELVLCGSEESWLHFGVLLALCNSVSIGCEGGSEMTIEAQNVIEAQWAVKYIHRRGRGGPCPVGSQSRLVS